MSPRIRHSGVRSALAISALLAALPSCKLAGTEKHLAPLYTRLSVARPGDRAEDGIEAVAGSIVVRRDRPDALAKEWMLRPLVDWRRIGPESTERTVLFPFGLNRITPEESVGYFLPIFRYQENYDAEGLVESYSFLSILGIYWAQLPDGSQERVWFPFAGVLENSLSFDRLEFILFPLYARSVRSGRTKTHILFPVFATSSGSGGRDGRLWPLIGRSRYRGRYDRWFFLWPIFHFHRNNLRASDPAQHETKWMVFPLYGVTKAGTFRSDTVLWPFFGYARDSESGFRAWDGPWPLVRIQRPGTSGQAERTRFWPFYSSFEKDGLESTYYGWPVHTVREETYPRVSKSSRYVIPFWHSWRRREEDGPETRFDKLWPLWQRHQDEDTTRTAVLALSPLWHYPEFERRWSWLWELWSQERGSGIVRERSWLGLWRRESDGHEDRRSLSGVWAGRRYRGDQGEVVHETSLLFGLLRWRRSAEGLQWLPPAMPGPGWPKLRAETRLDPRVPAGHHPFAIDENAATRSPVEASAPTEEEAN